MTTSVDVVDLLAREYIQLQSTHEAFDDRALLIKGWSVTVCLAGLAKAIELKSAAIMKLSAAAALLFWLIEAIWKSFQGSFEPRIIQIEEAFRSDQLANLEQLATSLKPFQIYTAWDAAWSETWWHVVPSHLIQPPVFLPHALTVCLAFYLLRRMNAALRVP